MQLVVNFENASQLDFIKSLLVQNGFTSFFVEDESEDDAEDVYWLKIIEERKDEPTTSWEDVKRNLNL